MRTLTALTATALAALVMVAPADAQGRLQRQMAPRGAGMRLHAPAMGGQMAMMGLRAGTGLGLYQPQTLVRQREFLELTDQQVAGLEQLEARIEEARDGTAEAVREHREALAEALDADRPDVNAVRQHAEALHAAQQTVHLAHVTAVAEAKGLLTDEQRTKIEAWMAGARRGAAMGGRGMMMPRGRMPMHRDMRPMR